MVKEAAEKVENVSRMIEVLDPIGIVKPKPVQPASRVKELDGQVIGFLDNHKPNFDVFLGEIERLIREQHHPREVLSWRKITAASGAGPVLDEIKQRCQVAITGSGD